MPRPSVPHPDLEAIAARVGGGDFAFWTRWVSANALAEAAGLGIAAAGGWLGHRTLGASSTPIAALALAAVAVALGAVEGAIVGLAQANVLRRRLPALRGWVSATVIGAAAAWTLGMLPSTAMKLWAPEAAGPAREVSQSLQYALAAGLGLIAGPLLAWPQARVLARHVGRFPVWLGANALAWCAAMPVIFAGIDVAHAAPSWPLAALAVAASFALAGAVAGAIHGAFLVRLLHAPLRSAAQ